MSKNSSRSTNNIDQAVYSIIPTDRNTALVDFSYAPYVKIADFRFPFVIPCPPEDLKDFYFPEFKELSFMAVEREFFMNLTKYGQEYVVNLNRRFEEVWKHEKYYVEYLEYLKNTTFPQEYVSTMKGILNLCNHIIDTIHFTKKLITSNLRQEEDINLKVRPTQEISKSINYKPTVKSAVDCFVALYVLGRLGVIEPFIADSKEGSKTNENKAKVTAAAKWGMENLGFDYTIEKLYNYTTHDLTSKSRREKFPKVISFLGYHYPDKVADIKRILAEFEPNEKKD